MPKTSLLVAAPLFGFLSLTACGDTSPSLDDAAIDPIGAATDRATALAMACSGCHGAQSDAVVSLDDYGADALRETLRRYQTESDGTTVMHRLARGYTDEDVDLLVTYFNTEGVEP